MRNEVFTVVTARHRSAGTMCIARKNISTVLKKKKRENKNNRNNVGIPGAKTESFRLSKKKRFIYPLRVSGNELPLSRSIEYDFSFRSYIKLQTGTVSREASANKGELEKEKEEKQEEEEEEEDVAVESREFE